MCFCLHARIRNTDKFLLRYFSWIIVIQLVGTMFIILGHPRLGMMMVNTAFAVPRLIHSEFAAKVAGNVTRIWQLRNDQNWRAKLHDLVYELLVPASTSSRARGGSQEEPLVLLEEGREETQR